MDKQENDRTGFIAVFDLDETDFEVLHRFLVCILVAYPRQSYLQR